MHKTELLEWALARFTERDRATAILGDLLETAKTKGRVWFWVAFARVLARLAWRGPTAWSAAYTVSGLMIVLMVSTEVLGDALGSRVAGPYNLATKIAAIFMATLGQFLSYVAPYSAVRFGMRNRFSRIAMCLFVVITLGFVLSAFQTTVIACAGITVASILIGLILRGWRKPMLALMATFGLAVACAAGTFGLMTSLGRGLTGSMVSAGLVSFVISLTICSRAQSLLNRTNAA